MNKQYLTLLFVLYMDFSHDIIYIKEFFIIFPKLIFWSAEKKTAPHPNYACMFQLYETRVEISVQKKWLLSISADLSAGITITTLVILNNSFGAPRISTLDFAAEISRSQNAIFSRVCARVSNGFVGIYSQRFF